MDNKRKFQTAEEVRAYLQQLKQKGKVKIVPCGEAMQRSKSCVDGRENQEAVIGTAGGDFAEFLLGLHAVEQSLQRTLTEEQIYRLLESYAAGQREPLYWHNDTHGMHHLIETLGENSDPQIAHIGSAATAIHSSEDYERFISQLGGSLTTQEQETHLLELLSDPNNIGCGHIKLMLNNADQYGIRKELVRAFIKAFYKLLWSENQRIAMPTGLPKHPSVRMRVLEHEHEESAVLIIQVEELEQGENPDALVPALTPSSTRQVFVYTPQLVQLGRAHIAQFLQYSEMYAADAAEIGIQLAAEMKRLGNQQLGLTVNTLATKKGIKTFSVKFRNGTVSDVREV